MPKPTSKKQSLSPHFFRRDEDGTVRVRMRFSAEEASLIEEAAGDTPLITYLHRVMMDRAQVHANRARKERRKRLAESEDE